MARLGALLLPQSSESRSVESVDSLSIPVTASSMQKLLRKIPNIGTVRTTVPQHCGELLQPVVSNRRPRAAATYVPVCRRIPPLLCRLPGAALRCVYPGLQGKRFVQIVFKNRRNRKYFPATLS